jgi:hypothetical protein
VVKARRIPCRGRVAQRASCWEATSDVSWIGGAGKVRFMAGVAIGGRSREHVINVASRAGHGGVGAG